MKKTIWTTFLSLSTILRIVVRYHFKNIDRIKFINCTLPVRIIFAFLNIINLKDRYLIKINTNPIRGPRLNFAEIYDKNGRIITNDIMYKVMQLRREIVQSIIGNKKTDVLSFYDQKSARPILGAFIEMQIAKDINYAMHFAYYIKFLDANSEDKMKDNILILTWKDWGGYLEQHIKEMGVNVWMIKPGGSIKFILLMKIFLIYLLELFLALKQYLTGMIFGKVQGIEKSITQNNNLKKNKSLKIFAPYSMSILPAKRNGLPWLWRSDIEKDGIVVLVPSDVEVLQEEYLAAESYGITLIKQVSWQKWITSIWNPSASYASVLLGLLRNHLTMMRKVLFHSTIEMLWQVYHLVAVAYRIAYYKDFYLANNIIVDISSEDSEDMFLRALVMEEIGGITVSWERSIRFGYSHFIHNKPVHVEFVSGDYSLTVLPEKTNAKFLLKSGWINDYGIEDFKKEAKLIKDSLKIFDKCISIGLFDEIWGDHILSKKVVEDFYRRFLRLAIEKPYYKLIIKPKKQIIINNMAEEIRILIKEAQELGRCVVLDPLQHICSVAIASDLVVALPSMAVFESILSGNRTVIFNYGRFYSDLFYKDAGLGRVVFEDLNDLLAAIEEFVEGLRPDLGDCSAILAKIDSFRDGNAGKRVGNYIDWFIEGLDSGMDRDSALNMANRRFASLTNEYKEVEKITC